MKGLKSVKLGLAGVVAVAMLTVGGFLLASQVAAATGTLGIGSASMAPGAQGNVDLSASVTSPGLGAWTVDITYDPAVVSVPSGGCTAQQNGVCNPAYTATQIRITGASASGLSGAKVLGTITFQCNALGTSALTLTTNVFADATIGNPTNVTPTVTNGSITCAAATATPLPTLVVTGTGPASDGGMGYSWLIALLTAAGIAGLAGYTVLRLRARVG
jgi:hypothetical protein